MARSFDGVADRFDETRSHPPEQMERMVSALVEALSGDSMALEVGVGTGRFAAPLSRKGLDIVGIDLSRGMLERARSKGLDGILQADAHTMPFRDGVFDHALSVHVLHLVRDWMRVLEEVGRVTRGNLVSLASGRTASQTHELRETYEKACAEEGFEICDLGIRERDLVEVVSPCETRVVSEYCIAVSAEDLLEEYRSRCFSDQWGVPDEVHEGAVRVLEERLAGIEELERRERITMLVWSMDSIRDFVASRRT